MAVSASRLLGAAAALAVSLGAAQMQANAGRIVRDSMILNYSSDPNAQYGLCLPGNSGTAMKLFPVMNAGETFANILAITVLECREGQSEPAHKVPCPANSPYAYCINVGQDGQGNYATFGIMKADDAKHNNDPNALYSGCPNGATRKPKLRLVRNAGQEPRQVKAIVTLSCGAATVQYSVTPKRVACPAGPDPYEGYCLGTPNDGFGNAVVVGVVKAVGQGDPYGLYGNCNTLRPHIQPGFLRKSTLVESVGRSLASVRTIDVVACSELFNMPPGIPADHLEVVPCSKMSVWRGYQELARRYDYCIWGSDSKKNGLFVGVNADNTGN